MDEYIDRKALRDALYDADAITMNGVKILNQFPSADVAPVKHGRWISWEEQFPDKKPIRKNNLGVFCNKCTNHADNRTDYCPNCGARMDGDSNA